MLEGLFPELQILYYSLISCLESHCACSLLLCLEQGVSGINPELALPVQLQQPKVGRSECDPWILCLLAEDLDGLRAGAFPASNPGCDCEIHGQVTMSQVHKTSPQHGLRDTARLSFGIPGCCSSTNRICKLFTKCLWTTKAQKENHVFYQPSMQIVRFPLVLFTTEGRAVSNTAVPASAAQHREEATPCPDLMISFCVKSFPQQQQTWTVNSNRSRVDSKFS